MQKKKMPDFTTCRTLNSDGSLEFRCNFDLSIWPWQALHPHDPIYLQTINFWAPFEAGIARGEYTTEKWTALTETRWTLGDRDVGHPVYGIALALSDGKLGYDISLYDKNDALVYRLTGKGVVFQNRDFGAWRQQAKDKIAALPKPDKFDFAPKSLSGSASQAQCFISVLSEDKTAQALVTMENGFIPQHPYLSGSGDHVNATHLHVIGDQMTRLVEDGKSFSSPSGTMTFNRYVEIGHPIDVKVNTKSDGFIDLSFFQAGKLCAGMAFQYKLNSN